MKVKELIRMLDMLPLDAEARFSRTTIDGHITTVPIKFVDIRTIAPDIYHHDMDKVGAEERDVVLLS